MATRTKKIETMKVSLPDGDLLFHNILNSLNGIDYNERSGKLFSLNRISENDSYFLGSMNTTKQSGIPPKHNPINKTYERIPINDVDGEGLGYSNVFVYDKMHQILMYEFNQNGCYLTSFHRYLIINFNNDSENAINLSFIPLLRREAYERMLSMDIYKTLEVEIATPSTIIDEYLEENDALTSVVRTSQQLNSDTVTLKFDIKGRPIEGMPSQIISNLVRRVHRLFDHEEDLVNKFKITGYYQDLENEVRSKDVIDLLLDRYQKTFNVEEPDVFSDPQTREKANALLNVYLECRNELGILAPIV
jgi:hypothetical protein